MDISSRSRFLIVTGLTLIPRACIMAVALVATYFPIFKSMENIVYESMEEMIPLVMLEGALHRAVMPPNDYLIHGDSSEKDEWRRTVDNVERQFEIVAEKLDFEWEQEKLKELYDLWIKQRAKGEIIMQGNPGERSPENVYRMEDFDAGIYDITEEIHLLHHEMHQFIDSEYRKAKALKGKAFIATVIALLVSLLAGFSASMILTRDRKQLVTVAETDPLTGIHNRRALDAKLKLLISNTAFMKRPCFSVLMMDLDHFKQVNDEHGHDIGDEVLRHFARLVEENMRAHDYFARWGGEEFVLVLPETDREMAHRVAERVREAVNSDNFVLADGRKIDCTVSIGGGIWPDNGEDYVEVIKQADKALYQAKKSGRNQVMFS